MLKLKVLLAVFAVVVTLMVVVIEAAPLTEAQTPAPVRDGYSFVSAGYSHTCGVRADGTVHCWGSNVDFDDRWLGQATPPSGSFSSISAGLFFHTCGIRTDGDVACWGEDDNGQATPPSGSFSVVSAGAQHTCGVRTTGIVL